MRSENYLTAIIGGGGVILGATAQEVITFVLGAVLIIVSIISNVNASKKHKAERKLAEEQLSKLKKDNEKN